MHAFPMVQADFSGIGADIAGGAAHALLDILKAVPFSMWVILIFALLAVVFVMRYATNWKVDATVLAFVFVACEFLAIRQHFIYEGREQDAAKVKAAQEQVEAYRKTNALIEGCYAQDTYGFKYVWDRTDGECKRIDGAK